MKNMNPFFDKFRASTVGESDTTGSLLLNGPNTIDRKNDSDSHFYAQKELLFLEKKQRLEMELETLKLRIQNNQLAIQNLNLKIENLKIVNINISKQVDDKKTELDDYVKANSHNEIEVHETADKESQMDE